MMLRSLMAAKKSVAGYRYLRINITTGSAGGMAINELYWRVGATDYPTVGMTSNTAPSPLVCSYSSAAVVGSYSTYGAFDRGGFIWTPTSIPAWLQIDLGSGNGILPTGLGLKPDANKYPQAFTCLGSNTGTFTGEEALLYTYSGGATGWAYETLRSFTF